MAVGFYVRTCTYMYDTIELIQLTYRNVLYIPSQDTIEARLPTTRRTWMYHAAGQLVSSKFQSRSLKQSQEPMKVICYQKHL